MTIIHSECGSSADSESEVVTLISRSPPCNHNIDMTPCAICSDLTEVESQIEDLHSHLKELHAKHRLLRTKRNDLYSVITKLPYDITSEIIIGYCLPPRQTDHHTNDEPCSEFETLSLPLELGSVCHSWRHLVYSIPRLWSTISINVHEYNLQKMNHYLQVSGTAPLDLRLYSKGGSARSSPNVLKAMALVRQNLHRLAYLCIHIPCPLIEVFSAEDFDRPMAMPFLKEFHLHSSTCPSSSKNMPGDCPCSRAFTFKLSIVPPRPHKVLVSGFFFKGIHLDWDHVCHIFLGETEPEGHALRTTDAIWYLSRAKKLQVVDLALGYSDLPSLTGVVITQNSVCDLRLFNEIADIIFSHTTMPNLESLKLWDSEPSTTDHLLSFLQRSACPLQTLEWSSAEVPTERELLSDFQYTPKLQRLYLNFAGCDSVGMKFGVLEQLYALASQDDSEPASQYPRFAFLPFLRKFVYAGTTAHAPLSLFLHVFECRSGTPSMMEGYQATQPFQELVIYIPEDELTSMTEEDRQCITLLQAAGKEISVLEYVDDMECVELANQ